MAPTPVNPVLQQVIDAILSDHDLSTALRLRLNSEAFANDNARRQNPDIATPISIAARPLPPSSPLANPTSPQPQPPMSPDPQPHVSAPTTPPRSGNPTTLTQHNYEIPLHKDKARLYHMMGLRGDNGMIMRDIRKFMNIECYKLDQYLNEPFSRFTLTQKYELTETLVEKVSDHFGDRINVTYEIIEAIIHRLCLDNVRNRNQRKLRRSRKFASSSKTATAANQSSGAVKGENRKTSGRRGRKEEKCE